MIRPPLLSIVGPTASGKTGLAVQLAQRLDAEIINVDSMQLYQELNVGTDKANAKQRAMAPFHMLDLIPPEEEFDAARFGRVASDLVIELHKKGKLAIAAGGTGLYHRALCYGLVNAPGRDLAFREELQQRKEIEGLDALYQELSGADPQAAAKIHPNDWVRIERALEVLHQGAEALSAQQQTHGFKEARFHVLSLGCCRPREALYARIEARLDEMWRSGLLEETKDLLCRDLDPERLPLKALGYRHAAAFLKGEVSEEEALQLAKRDTRRYAKRQLTWFRRTPDITWIETPLSDAHADLLAQALKEAIDAERTCFNHEGLPILEKV